MRIPSVAACGVFVWIMGADGAKAHFLFVRLRELEARNPRLTPLDVDIREPRNKRVSS